MLSARIPAYIEDSLLSYATQLGMSKSALALTAIEDFLQRRPLVPASELNKAKPKAGQASLSQQLQAIHTRIAQTASQKVADPDWREARDAGRL